MKLLVGGVRGVDYSTQLGGFVSRKEEDGRTLPLDKSIHAHEGGELLWNQRKPAIGEDRCIPEFPSASEM